MPPRPRPSRSEFASAQQKEERLITTAPLPLSVGTMLKVSALRHHIPFHRLFSFYFFAVWHISALFLTSMSSSLQAWQDKHFESFVDTLRMRNEIAQVRGSSLCYLSTSPTRSRCDAVCHGSIEACGMSVVLQSEVARHVALHNFFCPPVPPH